MIPCHIIPLNSSFSHHAFPSPATVVLAVVRLPSNLVDDTIGGNAKSDNSGVIDMEAPVSMTIESSPL